LICPHLTSPFTQVRYSAPPPCRSPPMLCILLLPYGIWRDPKFPHNLSFNVPFSASPLSAQSTLFFNWSRCFSFNRAPLPNLFCRRRSGSSPVSLHVCQFPFSPGLGRILCSNVLRVYQLALCLLLPSTKRAPPFFQRLRFFLISTGGKTLLRNRQLNYFELWLLLIRTFFTTCFWPPSFPLDRSFFPRPRQRSLEVFPELSVADAFFFFFFRLVFLPQLLIVLAPSSAWGCFSSLTKKLAKLSPFLFPPLTFGP